MNFRVATREVRLDAEASSAEVSWVRKPQHNTLRGLELLGKTEESKLASAPRKNTRPRAGTNRPDSHLSGAVLQDHDPRRNSEPPREEVPTQGRCKCM